MATAKKTTKTKTTKTVKKPAAKTAAKKTTVKKVTKKPEIKNSVTGKKAVCDKPSLTKIICIVVSALAICVIIAAVIVKGQLGMQNYFVSDDTKYVLNVTASENDNGIVVTHLVYTYEGDTVTGAAIYYEFTNASTAKEFYDNYIANRTEEEIAEDSSTYKLDGKYIIMIADESHYKDLSAAAVKAEFEAYEEMLKEASEEE